MITMLNLLTLFVDLGVEIYVVLHEEGPLRAETWLSDSVNKVVLNNNCAD